MAELSAVVKAETHQGNPGHSITKKTLQARVNKRLGQLAEILDKDDLFAEKVRRATFKDITVAEAILVDKWLLLNNEPTQIVSHEERRKLDELLPALVGEMERRGFSARIEAHSASMTVTPPATVQVTAVSNPLPDE